MTDAPNPFAAWLSSAQDMARAMNPALESFTPQGFEKLWPTMPKEVMETFMGKGPTGEGLDAKSKLLLTLAGLTVTGAQAEAQIRMTVRHAVEAGATKQEIMETIGMMGLFGGMPAMNKAMTLATDALETDE
ncbi:carboxymuconolactone decarboxylase family protein [Jannaschia sp. Os4]|uniref:carboxymuconolactone decarboxylase family protein n=1 Tax=Jannaschia sp. Os4 TaxID=2807617 RepID=UPI00193A00D9|nr:carboxymuconolactone decarboxylase family protein [Jannaschia sp. Os4]MBM2576203.1 carboxymuconolactone decarboxylase family protein [Jannaschia sp. Os4]